jgi:aminoglycoside phosphotransferase (APT) family kinase protein
LYQIATNGQHYACKLCVSDGRSRARREYDALHVLHYAGLDVAPEPLGIDESCTVVPYPAVIYRWARGRALRPPLSADQLYALLESVQAIHSLRPGDCPDEIKDAWFHWFDVTQYLSELEAFLEQYGGWLAATDPGGAALQKRLADLVKHSARVAHSAHIDASRESVPICLCHVDPNLANTVLSPTGRLRWVDWEYSGWGDPALDLAELRWHASLEALTVSQQSWLRNRYRRPDDDAAFDSRLRVWDHILAARWPFLILRSYKSQFHGPDRVRLSQPKDDPAELRARLVRALERAEGLIITGRSE